MYCKYLVPSISSFQIVSYSGVCVYVCVCVALRKTKCNVYVSVFKGIVQRENEKFVIIYSLSSQRKMEIILDDSPKTEIIAEANKNCLN